MGTASAPLPGRLGENHGGASAARSAAASEAYDGPAASTAGETLFTAASAAYDGAAASAAGEARSAASEAHNGAASTAGNAPAEHAGKRLRQKAVTL